MATKRPKNIKKVTSKGATYWYHRVTGEQLPSNETDRNRRVYEINKDLEERARRGDARTFNALRTLYLQQPKFQDLSESTRRDYRRKLDIICQMIGDEAVEELTTPDVYAIADHFADTPRKADLILSVLSLVMKLAVRKGWSRFNPAAGFERMAKSKPFKEWPLPVLKAVLDAADVPTQWAILGLLETGLRVGDFSQLRAPTEDDIEAGAISLIAQKTSQRTRAEAHAALTPDLQSLVDEINASASPPQPGTPLFRNARGKPWTRFSLAKAIRAAVSAAGHAGYSAHGLRHTRGNILAEQGASARELMSALAHKSMAMALHYSDKANRKRMARKAAGRVSESDRAERVVNLRKSQNGKLLENWKTPTAKDPKR